MVTVPDGGYDFEQVSDTETRVTIHNVFEGHGFGKLVVGFAVKAAIKDAPAFAQRIKAAVEAATPAAGEGDPAASAAADAPAADVPAADAPLPTGSRRPAAG